KTLAIARGLVMRGHEVRLYIDGTDVEIEASLTLLRQTGHLDYARFGGSISNLAACDALIATHWRTAYLVEAMADFAARSFYFVQDYEPYFYAMGESYIRADHSYDLGLFIISYGSWCLKEIETRHKCAGDIVPYFIDQEQYDAAPANWRERNKILFFARPDMERRCYYMGVQALDQLQRRLNIKEKGFEIVMFGSEKPLGSLPFPHSNLGVVSPAQLAELYRSARLGLALSTTNMSMVSYEMMACGCPIVDFDIHNNAEMYGGRENVFLAEPDPDRVAQVMVNALTNHEQAQQVAERAYRFTKRFPAEMEVIAAFEKIVFDEVRHRTSA
ncbi:MAG TPA: glycosyltransferase family 4 protein, partial [Anaerolineae bacterium]|nr:glycosyltransferase family 4 protein [Anaerolineae bacterium]